LSVLGGSFANTIAPPTGVRHAQACKKTAFMGRLALGRRIRDTAAPNTGYRPSMDGRPEESNG
jgi:hypothetical protein